MIVGFAQKTQTDHAGPGGSHRQRPGHYARAASHSNAAQCPIERALKKALYRPLRLLAEWSYSLRIILKYLSVGNVSSFRHSPRLFSICSHMEPAYLGWQVPTILLTSTGATTSGSEIFLYHLKLDTSSLLLTFSFCQPSAEYIEIRCSEISNIVLADGSYQRFASVFIGLPGRLRQPHCLTHG
jgi:hypothetical protein